MPRIIITFAVTLFGVFMVLPMSAWFHKYLDYDRSLFTVLLYYAIGTLIIAYATGSWTQDVNWSLWAIAYAIVTAIIVVVFSRLWQQHGRSLMPRTPYSDPATTFYDFTGRYVVGKIAEIIFQNTVAVIIITNIFILVDNSVVMTGLWFGVLFLIPHLVAVYFLGKEWALFVVVASVIAATVPPVLILLVPGGVLILMCFHILMYLLFLIVMRRLALVKKNRAGGAVTF